MDAPKYPPGTTVEIMGIPGHAGWTGLVVAVDVGPRRYLLDCYPGAVAGYGWYWVGDRCFAGNWFDEKDLRPT